MREVAIVAYAQSPQVRQEKILNEVEMSMRCCSLKKKSVYGNSLKKRGAKRKGHPQSNMRFQLDKNTQKTST